MASYLYNKNKQNCSFCRACIQICPVSALYEQPDENGFLFPEKDSTKCINCNRCLDVCQFENTIKVCDDNQKFFACKSKENSTRFLSTSGGAFSAVAECFCDKDYVLFGAVFDKDLKVKHDYTEDIKDLGRFRKSKYVQSNPGDSFIKAKEFLKAGKKVLFSGTPCQIAGLRKYLGKDYENLFCIDIVCHGIPSQALFDKYISELSDELSDKVTEFTFRSKDKFETNNCSLKTARIKTEKGKEITKQVLECEYLAAFYEEMFYRDSCEACLFANTDRVGDITLGDFWGIEQINKEFDDGKGISLIIANTEKGRRILPLLDEKLEMVESDKEHAVKKNAQLRKPVKCHENREKFFMLNKENTFCYSVRQCMFIPSPLRLKVSNMVTPIKKIIRKLK